MGKVDAAIKDFMLNRQNFADAFNQAIFGEELIQADKLHELNANLVTPVFASGSGRVSGKRERTLDDLQIAEVAMGDGQFNYLLLAGQYQQLVHYAMPVRAMLETAMLYERQVREISRRGEKKSTEHEEPQIPEVAPARNDSAEFLSGLGPEDRLHPVVMMVLYLGEDPWEHPKSLWDMLDTKDPRILRHCPNFALNLVTPEQFSDASRLWNTEFGKAMYMISLGRQGMKNLLRLESNSVFESVDRTTVRMLNTVMNTNISLDRNNGEKGGSINMCKAVREINETIKMQKDQLAQQKDQLAQQKDQLAQQKDQLAQQKDQLAQKDSQLAQKESLIEALLRENSALKAQLGLQS